jgi:hypothetical protein
MPYKIKKIKNGDYVRINKKTGKIKAHHKSKSKALAAIRAIYANESLEHKKFITVYHGTSIDKASIIEKEKKIRGYFGWGVGLCLNISRARSFTIYAVQRYAKKMNLKFSSDLLYESGKIVVLKVDKKIFKNALKEPGNNDAYTLQDENLSPLKELNLNDKQIVKQWKIISLIQSEKYLNEEFVGSIAKTFNVDLKIDKTNHATIRQKRKENDFISNEEIKNTIDKAMMKIVSRLLTDKFFIGDKIHIFDSKTDLNIVGQIKLENQKLEFVIITVMRERNFHQKSDTKFLLI